MTGEQILNQIIWNNSYIRVNNKPVRAGQWAYNGCVYVKDILDEELRFNSYQSMTQKYGNQLNWLEYQSLCTALPKKWLKTLKNESSNEGDFHSTYGQVYNATKKVVTIYSELKNSQVAIQKLQNKLSKIGINVSQDRVMQAFRDIYKITNVSKL